MLYGNIAGHQRKPPMYSDAKNKPSCLIAMALQNGHISENIEVGFSEIL